MTKYIGKCKVCEVDLYHDDDNPVSNKSNVGDWDFICYPCQFRAIEDGTWDELKSKYR